LRKHFLYNVFRVRLLTDDVESEGKNGARVSVVQVGERVSVALGHALESLLVRARVLRPFSARFASGDPTDDGPQHTHLLLRRSDSGRSA
jgi:hypothetical protein